MGETEHEPRRSQATSAPLRVGGPGRTAFQEAIQDDGHDDNVGRDGGGNGAGLPHHPRVRGARDRRVHQVPPFLAG
jgi:hypothetical protein